MTLKLLRSPFVSKAPVRRSRASFYRTPRATQNCKGKASNIKVCVRIRPLNSVELCYSDARLVVRPLDDKILVFDPYEAPPDRYYKGQLVKDLGVRRNKDLKLAFDYVFDSSATNNDVFELTTKNMLDHLMDGVNCSIFAYGATGAGKTYTMLGTYECPGVISRTMNELYNRMEAVKDDLICSVEVSYLEIYNENVRDLLNPESGTLAVREDGGSSLTISGLTLHKPNDAQHLFKMLEDGNRNRTQHPTDANKESSRSHAIFQVHLKQSPRTAALSTDVLVSKMVLVDLAGSERATATKNCGDRMREGANINRSLLALGNCINALAEGKKGAHIPYRDSKLTRILKDGLGGNCHTLMIANVSPSYSTYDDTQNTLKYADRAKHIKADLRKNVLRVDQHIHQYGKIVQDLHSEVDDLKAKYRQSQATVQELMRQKIELQTTIKTLENRQTFIHDERLFKDLRQRLVNYTTVQKEILAYESQKKLLQLKASSRERVQSCLNVLDYDPARNETDLSRTQRIKCQYESKIYRLDERLKKVVLQLQEIKDSIGEQMKAIKSSPTHLMSHPSYFFKDSELCQLEALAIHYEAMLKFERQKRRQSDAILNSFCALTREQHLILSSYGRLTTSLKTKFEGQVKQLEMHKDISWQDADDMDQIDAEKLLLIDYALHFSERERQSFPNGSNGYETFDGDVDKENNMTEQNKNENLDNASLSVRSVQLSSPSPHSINENCIPCRNYIIKSSESTALRPIENLNDTFSQRTTNGKSPTLNTHSNWSFSLPQRPPNKEDNVFKRPAPPLPRSLKPGLPPSVPRQITRSPSYTTFASSNGSSTGPSGLQKSPSFSNLKLKVDSLYPMKLKKTASTTNLRR